MYDETSANYPELLTKPAIAEGLAWKSSFADVIRSFHRREKFFRRLVARSFRLYIDPSSPQVTVVLMHHQHIATEMPTSEKALGRRDLDISADAAEIFVPLAEVKDGKEDHGGGAVEDGYENVLEDNVRARIDSSGASTLLSSFLRVLLSIHSCSSVALDVLFNRSILRSVWPHFIQPI